MRKTEVITEVEKESTAFGRFLLVNEMVSSTRLDGDAKADAGAKADDGAKKDLNAFFS